MQFEMMFKTNDHPTIPENVWQGEAKRRLGMTFRRETCLWPPLVGDNTPKPYVRHSLNCKFWYLALVRKAK